MGGHQLLPVLLFAATVLVPLIVGHFCKVKLEKTGRKGNSDLAF
jgi:hypothetical protein